MNCPHMYTDNPGPINAIEGAELLDVALASVDQCITWIEGVDGPHSNGIACMNNLRGFCELFRVAFGLSPKRKKSPTMAHSR